MRYPATLLCLALLAGCSGGGGSVKEKAPEPPPVVAKPVEMFGRFPKTNQVKVRVDEPHVLGKAFLPPGSIAEYQKGKSSWSMFVADFPSPTEAALALNDFRKALEGAKLVPAFGGYFGKDGDQPVFVFTKGNRIAGILGLSEKQADLPARQLASVL